MESVGYADIQMKVQFDLTQLGFAIEEFRLRNDRLPESLNEPTSDFIDQVPNDRFRNEPIIYRQSDSGYLVYSVGMDRIDNRRRQQSDSVDAGHAKTRPELAKGHDIVLRIEYADQK